MTQRIVVTGGYGLFGSRLVRRLARRPDAEIVIAGRSGAAAQALADSLREAPARVRGHACDVMAPGFAAELRALAPDVLVHTCGPFQGQSYDMARLCIAAGVHYVDLADGRQFVAGITALDAAARAAGVVVVSGASSVPALSSAAADALTEGWARVDRIDVGISPGNRSERGLATVQAILRYTGQPIAANAAGTTGWLGARRHDYGGVVGSRLLSPCDVPDLDLLPDRYAGRPAVAFGAGLELVFLHRGMNLMAWCAARGLVRDWSRHARPLKRMADLFIGWGSEAGAMHVQVDGLDASGQARRRRWQLIAAGGDGPYVPTLAAAALVGALARGSAALVAGAYPCIGVLGLAAILHEAEGLRIEAGQADVAVPSDLF